jgi:type IV pilus assembly protein PilA
MKQMNKKGFTIVELVIVIAVIAILAAVMIPTFSGIVDRANKSAALQEVKNAYTATIAEELSTPDTDDDKFSNLEADITVKASNGKFVTITTKGAASVLESETGVTTKYEVSGGKIIDTTPPTGGTNNDQTSGT